MSISRGEIINKLEEIDRYELVEGSAIREDNFFNDFVSNLDPKPIDIIEIGTANGVSTTVLASIGRLVYTYDIFHRDAEFVWNYFGVRHKIRYSVTPQEQIDDDIQAGIHKRITSPEHDHHFNFAFIDGGNSYQVAEHYFNSVKFCGRVLFHDYHNPGIREFLDKIEAKPMGKILSNGYHRYGYGEAK